MEERDLLTKILKQLGLDEEAGEQKLTFKHSIINHSKKNGIDHTESCHTMHIQRSNYMAVEQDPSKLVNPFRSKIIKVDDEDEKKLKFATTEEEIMHVPLSFCNPAEVNMKRQKFLMFK